MVNMQEICYGDGVNKDVLDYLLPSFTYDIYLRSYLCLA